MGRAPCRDKTKVKKGPWSPEEDATLRNYLQKHGTGGNWIALPHKAGLERCGKSCRLRWLNYLRPDIKHGGFTEEEDAVIYDLHSKLGSRWSVIASQLPGRTDNDVKNHWNTRLKKKQLPSSNINDKNSNPAGNPAPSMVLVPKTEPFTLMPSSSLPSQGSPTMAAHGLNVYSHSASHAPVHLPMPELTKSSELKQNGMKNYWVSSSEEPSKTLDSFSFSTENNHPSWAQNNGGSTIDFDFEFSCDLVEGIGSQEKASTEPEAAYADLVSYFHADVNTPGLSQSITNQY